MFHTPPVKQSWPFEAAIDNSYKTDVSDSSTDVKLNDNSEDNSTETVTKLKDKPANTKALVNEADTTPDKPKSDISAKIEFVGVNTNKKHPTILDSNFKGFINSDLPTRLLQECESFMKYLQEPQFSHPLATCEIADIFHQFYKKFGTDTHAFVYDNPKGVVEMSEYDKPRDYLYYKYNIICETIACDQFYKSILQPSKDISIDNYLMSLDKKFTDKLTRLNELDISFRDLDIDLPESKEGAFKTSLKQDIFPMFQLFISDHSPTLKLKHLYDIHMSLTKLIERFHDKNSQFAVNTDIYLPALIYTVLHLDAGNTRQLVSQLNFIKLFANPYIYDLEDEVYRNEKGKLLYVLTNFEACISYIASVTVDDLHVALPQEMEHKEILNEAIPLESIEEEAKKYKDEHIIPRSRSGTYFQQIFTSDSLYHADQGIRNISKSVDTSIRNIMGKVPWIVNNNNSSNTAELSGNENDIHNNIDPNLQQQLEENLAYQKMGKEEAQKVTPVSSNDRSSDSVPTNNSAVSVISDERRKKQGSDSKSSLGKGIEPIAIAPQGKLLNKFTNGLGYAVKNFLPGSASSSNSSLASRPVESTSSNGSGYSKKKPTKNRSRAASIMSGNIFGLNSSPQRSQTNSSQQLGDAYPEKKTNFLNTLESAIENVKNRSRGNSLSDHSPMRRLNSSMSLNSQVSQTKLKEQACQCKKFNKPFEEMTIQDLKEMYKNYQSLMSALL